MNNFSNTHILDNLHTQTRKSVRSKFFDIFCKETFLYFCFYIINYTILSFLAQKGTLSIGEVIYPISSLFSLFTLSIGICYTFINIKSLFNNESIPSFRDGLAQALPYTPKAFLICLIASSLVLLPDLGAFSTLIKIGAFLVFSQTLFILFDDEFKNLSPVEMFMESAGMVKGRILHLFLFYLDLIVRSYIFIFVSNILCLLAFLETLNVAFIMVFVILLLFLSLFAKYRILLSSYKYYLALKQEIKEELEEQTDTDCEPQEDTNVEM